MVRRSLAWLCLSLAVANEVVLGPFGPVSSDADSKLLARLRRDSLGPTKTAASAQVMHPTGLLVHRDKIYASEFRRDRVLVATTARAARDAIGGPGGSGAWTVFADRGPHCATDRATGLVSCARLDGAWGLAGYGALVFVSSFGSDEILAFHGRSRKFKFSLTGDLDSPEGLAVSGTTLFAASFLDSRLIAFDLGGDGRPRRGAPRTLAFGRPVEVDFEALAFVEGASPFDEAATRAAREAAAALWGDDGGGGRRLGRPAYIDRLRGPEQLVVLSNESIAVSSLHNDSVLEIDVRTGRLVSVLADGAADGKFAGPLGIAIAPPGPIADAADADASCGGADAARTRHLLVASYRNDAVSLLREHCDDAAPLALDDDLLRGPTAIALDPTDAGGVYVAAYESSAVLYFNVSHFDEAADRMLRRIASRLE